MPNNLNKVVPSYEGIDILVLRFEHSIAIGVQLKIMSVVASCFSIFWAIIKSDISAGFSMGAYMVTLAALITTLYVRNRRIT